MSKINESLVMMAEQKETFEVNGKKFQIIEVKEAEQPKVKPHPNALTFEELEDGKSYLLAKRDCFMSDGRKYVTKGFYYLAEDDFSCFSSHIDSDHFTIKDYNWMAERFTKHIHNSEQQPDYSHLVGKFVRCITRQGNDYDFGKFYQVSNVESNHITIIDDKEDFRWNIDYLLQDKLFDLSNPSDTNPDEKKVWEKANEAMWAYGSVDILTRIIDAPEGFTDHLQSEWKHIRAYLFLSKFADLCNDGMVVDWTDDEQRKSVVSCDENDLYMQGLHTDQVHIAFLDEEARDYSLKVHEQIWKDYWGIE